MDVSVQRVLNITCATGSVPFKSVYKEVTFSNSERLDEEVQIQRKTLQESGVYLSQTHMPARGVSGKGTIMRWNRRFCSQHN